MSVLDILETTVQLQAHEDNKMPRLEILPRHLNHNLVLSVSIKFTSSS